ncbi:uncharacterized protein V1518DRAFT_371382 [Limtongia smithiae]|uniref:uncharacterized protein n=1 Tax=Limtongia smithiae TaxID=1125753 RepID=UPI0034CD8BAE
MVTSPLLSPTPPSNDDVTFVLKSFPNKYPTNIYDVPPAETALPESGVVVLIPGNPGLPAYYVPFLSDLRAQLRTWRIICISQAGCEVTATQLAYSCSTRYYGLKDQVQHKYEVIKTLLTEHGYTPTTEKKVVLMGHSIGCWLLQHSLIKLIADSYAEDAVKTPSLAILLFPTVKDIGDSSNGIRFRKVMKIFPFLPNAASVGAYCLTACLPTSLLRRLIKCSMHDPPTHALDATYSLLNSSACAYQCTRMGMEEMEEVREEDPIMNQVFWAGNWGRHDGRPGKIIAYFAKDDHWVASRTRAQLFEAHSARANVELIITADKDNCEHSFCVKQSEIMALHAYRWIVDYLGDEQQQ